MKLSQKLPTTTAVYGEASATLWRQQLKQCGKFWSTGRGPSTNTTKQPLPEVLLVDWALEKLETMDSDKAVLVKLKYFVGLSLEESAAALGMSRSTAYRHWNCARVMLKQIIDTELNS
jgi:DNA-directed RNA polymerase specialized sigma24 family protein